MKVIDLVLRFKNVLNKSGEDLIKKLELLFNRSTTKSDFMEKLEELLILSDLGTSATYEILNKFDQINFREFKNNNFNFFKEKLKSILTDILDSSDSKINIDKEKLNVIMIVGVNGSGKTSIAGKIAYRLKKDKNNILLVPADTFRAAAIKQLKILADRAGVEMINTKEGADPASVVYDGIKAAKARKKNVLIIDTAGRLHTKVNLMNELEKIKRVIEKEDNNISLEILQVIDATMGQNAIYQAKSFDKSLGVTGIALSKMDGTSKGGIVIAIKKDLNIPIKLISLGQNLNNLYNFEVNKFVGALLN